MPRRPLVLICGFALVAAARAAEFSWEPSGVASRLDQDPLIEVDRSSLAVTHYFDPVDDAAGPYGLASFLDPATRVSASVEREESRVLPFFFIGPSPPPLSELVTETDEYSVGGRYVFPESKWYAGGRYRQGDVDESRFSTATTESDGYGVLAGKYFGTATTLELTYDSFETRRERPVLCFFAPGCPVGATTTETTQTDEWGIAAQHVLRGRALTYSLSGRIAATRADLTVRAPLVLPTFPVPGVVLGPVAGFLALPSNFELDLGDFRVYSVAGELFPTPRVGVRIGYSRWDGDSSIDDAYDVTATWFVARSVGLAFTFSRQRGEGVIGNEVDTAALRIVGRF